MIYVDKEKENEIVAFGAGFFGDPVPLYKRPYPWRAIDEKSLMFFNDYEFKDFYP